MTLRIRDEGGQALVMFVFALALLFVVLGLVIDVGGWMRSQRRAQSVADAAALAAVQELPDSFAAADTANAYAQQNWPGVQLQLPAPPDPATQVDVVARRDVGGIFGGLTGVFDVTVSASAEATVGSPASLPDVAPIGLECNASCTAWPDGQSFQFLYIDGFPRSSTLAPLELPGVQDRRDFQRFVACDARNPDPADCNAQKATAPASYQLLALNQGNVRSSLIGAEGAAHLFPVYDLYSSFSGYRVIGWAVGTLDVESGSGSIVTVDVTFQRFVVDGALLPSGAQAPPADFGVRAIALTR